MKSKEENEFLQNTHDRVKTILDNVQKLEQQNFNAINNNIIRKALDSLEESVKGDHVQESSLDAAVSILKNIKNKSSSEVKDPLTKAVLDSLHASREDFDKLSQEDKDKLLELNEQQREGIKSLDKNIREN